MSKQSLLLVDHDTRSMRVLEVSLRKAGFTVTTAVSVGDAIEKLEVHAPDLIISETTFPSEQADGFELRRRVRGTPEWSEIPFIFLTAEQTIENKIKGLELGVDDYLTKPIYIKEIVTRINILLQKRQRVRFEERRDGRTRFAGRVADMPVVDVIQTIEISRKSGVIQFVGDRGRQAAIYFRDGRVIDAEAGALQGEDAVYRLLTWSEGEFEVVFRTVRRREVITTSSQGLLMEGMRRLDEWSRLLEQLPPLTHRFDVDAKELSVRLGDVPDNNNAILRLIDGKRTLLEVIDACDVGDLECLQAISRLYFEEMLIDLDHDKPSRRDTSKPITAPSSPMSERGSGPIEVMAGPSSAPIAREVELRDDATPIEPTPAHAEITEPSAAIEQTAAPPSSEARDERTVESAAVEAVPADRPSGTIPVDEADIDEVVDDQHGVDQHAAEIDDETEEAEPMPGAFMGSYRQSSLRLIDEAVAAAQAIEPSLFEDEPAPAPRTTESAPAEAPTAPPPKSVTVSPGASLPGLVRLSIQQKPPLDEDSDDVDEGNGLPSGSILDELEFDYPTNISADDPTPIPIYRRKQKPAAPATPTKITREDSAGLRMIGSLGRDRAEASGELALGATKPQVTETQRELITILPRRSTTREVPIVGAEGPKTEPSPSKAKPDSAAGSDTSAASAVGGASSDGMSPATPSSTTESSPATSSTPPSSTPFAGAASTATASTAATPSTTSATPTTPSSVAVARTGEGDATPGDAKADDATPGDAKTSDATPGDAKAGDAKAGDAKAGDAKAGDATPGDAKASDAKTGDAKAGDGATAKKGPPAPRALPVEPPRTITGSERKSEPPLRKHGGPGGFAKFLMVVAAILAAVAVFTLLRRERKSATTPVVMSADAARQDPVADAAPSMVVDDGDVADPESDAAIAMGVDAGVGVDASAAMPAIDAGAPVKPDAGTATAPPADDPAKQAKVLYDQAAAALSEGDAEKALQLSDASLKLRKTARAHLTRAQALQRLDRIDEAVEATVAAERISPTFPLVYDLRGRILWSARRFDEARVAFEKFLSIEKPESKRAAEVKRLLDRPQ